MVISSCGVWVYRAAKRLTVNTLTLGEAASEPEDSHACTPGNEGALPSIEIRGATKEEEKASLEQGA